MTRHDPSSESYHCSSLGNRVEQLTTVKLLVTMHTNAPIMAEQ